MFCGPWRDPPRDECRECNLLFSTVDADGAVYRPGGMDGYSSLMIFEPEGIGTTNCSSVSVGFLWTFSTVSMMVSSSMGRLMVTLEGNLPPSKFWYPA